MYSEAHKSYDATNRLLSFNTDNMIRERAANAILSSNPSNVLDIATGTGDLAMLIAKYAKKKGLKTKVTGIDTNAGMLSVAREKASRNAARNVVFESGNALGLKYRTGTFDAVVCSFALKNFDSQERFLGEVRRVLKSNGTFVLIDISKPESALGSIGFWFYMRYMGLFGIATGKKLYKWLPKSTAEFSRKEFIKRVKEEGFREVNVREYLLGISYMLTCRK